MSYPRHREEDGVPPSPRFPAIEEDVLAYWKADGTFQASIDRRAGAPEWVFYDGPPFANGLPHYGHLLTGYAKDLFPRYQTMRGKQVQRRFGWDTHGLPAELEAMGVEAFNAAARESVLRYTQEWEAYVTRQARWVDFEHDYKTLDVTFMESVIWAFKQLYDKGLAYEGFRVLPYCWNDETPLSNHELRMDDEVYKSRQDQSVTVTFPLKGARARELGIEGVNAIAWTTTPWTLPTNLALAVGPDIAYAVVPAKTLVEPVETSEPDGLVSTGSTSQADGLVSTGSTSPVRYLLAVDTIASYAKELGYASAADAIDAAERTIAGRDLEGVEYERLWDFYADPAYGVEHAWRILVADYVATGEGTGIVHQAPAYGEEDQVTCEAAGIPVILSLDDGGRFLPQVPLVAGMRWDEANRPLTQALREMGRLLQVKSHDHPYPHCWRCKQPLIYKAVSSWFVRVTAFKDEMLALNERINWVPENVKHGQFGKWVGNARDWSISRNRYWGSPIPIWKSDDPAHPRVDVYGSLEELERDFGRLPLGPDGEPNLHRPYVDELTRPNPDDPTGRSTMRRIEDVFDVWFDSGSMPYAQVHYPFEHKEWFDTHNPADFIVEYIGQTRGWFYTMHILATALFGRPAFSNVLSHGIVLGNDGQKMSKSLRNYPDVSEVFDRDGADAMRWFLMSSSVIRGGNLVVTEEGIRAGVRELLLPLWSTYYFFTLYANAAGAEATWRTDSANELDRYILAKTRETLETVTAHLDAFDTPLAAEALRDFADVLTNWYVRRSRDRFWQEDRDAFDTLYTVLETVLRMAAPFLPLVAEEMWRGLTGERSVHLQDWPDRDAFPADAGLVATMDRVREIASAGLSLRKARRLRVRLPLPSVTVVGVEEDLAPYAAILQDELNVKAFATAMDEEGYGITRRLSVNARVLGPRIGAEVQQVIAAARAGIWSVEDGAVVCGGVVLEEGEYELVLEAADPSSAIQFLPGGGFVVLDTTTTPELEAEGLARDLIRQIQDARKAAGLDVADRIRLALTLPAEAAAAARAHEALIAGETLAVSLTIGEGDTDIRVERAEA